MQLVPIEQILDVSSEHPEAKLLSLITGFGSWTSEEPGLEKIVATLKLSDLVKLSRIEIGNESSAWIDIKACRSGTPFVTLVPTMCLQSRKESKDAGRSRTTRILLSEDFNREARQEKFDCVQVICRQPFNRTVRFGLSLLKLYAEACEKTNTSLYEKNGALNETQEDAVLRIVESKMSEELRNELVGSAIKEATFHGVSREKRYVSKLVNAGDNDSTELKPRETKIHLVDCSKKIVDLGVSASARCAAKVGMFIFSPRVSAAEQETRNKQADSSAERIARGRSPQKSKDLHEPDAIKSQPTTSLPARQSVEVPGRANKRAPRTSIPHWEQTRDVSNKLSKHLPFSVQLRSGSTALDSSKQQIYHDVKASDLEPSQSRTSWRGAPPKVCNLLSGALFQAEASTSRRSIAETLNQKRLNNPDSVGVRDKTKKPLKRKTSKVLAGMFSSSESERELTLTISDMDSQFSPDPQPKKIKSAKKMNSNNQRKSNDICVLDSDDENSAPVSIEMSYEVSDPVCKESTPIQTEVAVRSNPSAPCDFESDSDLEVVGNNVMKGVVFALSGFKNPYRSSLRSMAISMGARYRPQWDESCTHLICAFKKTPKYNDVRKKGGRIVTAAWIVTSHLEKKMADWRNYRFN